MDKTFNEAKSVINSVINTTFTTARRIYCIISIRSVKQKLLIIQVELSLSIYQSYHMSQEVLTHLNSNLLNKRAQDFFHMQYIKPGLPIRINFVPFSRVEY